MKWILFDIGGVLEIVDDDSWPETFRARLAGYAGLSVDEMRARAATADFPRSDLEAGTAEAYWQAVAEVLGIDPALLPRIRNEFWGFYCGTGNVELIEYARGLRGRAGTAILSNSHDGAREEEERRFGFSQVFDPICYSHEQGVGKPDRGAYEQALERMGAAPESVLFIDDHEECLVGARACGIRGQLHTDNAETIEAIEAFLVES